MENNAQPLSIPYPPEWVFRYRNKNRLAPAQSVMQQEQAMFVWERMEYPETGGQLAYFKGVPYPSKGHPFPEAIYAINFVKRMARASILAFVDKDMWKEYMAFGISTKKGKLRKISRWLESYCDIAERVLQPYILEDKYLSPCPYEIMEFLRKFLGRIGIGNSLAHEFSEIFAALIEYDNAYRLRIEDAMSETSKEGMLENPMRELERILRILKEREPVEGNFKHFEKFLGIIRILFWIPSVKRIFKETIAEADFKHFQLDEADRYHVLLWGDYNFLGKTLEERIKMYSEYHKDGYPPRILYKPT